MAMHKVMLVLAAMALPLSATPLNKALAARSGKSTFYGGDLEGGTCSFSTYTLPEGVYGVAYAGTSWDASECGACLRVTGPDGDSIKAMVVDKCPECEPGHLDLFPDAFRQLGPPSVGILATSYEPVPCGISDPLVLRAKSTASPHWFSMQVINAAEPVSELDVSTDGGSSWTPTTRTPYNFFEYADGFGEDVVDVRVTSISGECVVVTNVEVAGHAETTASANF